MRIIKSPKFSNIKKEYEVSVIVATYNPDYLKLKSTLTSIYMQNNVIIEIIISDDGSTNDYLYQSLHFLEEKGFYDYIGIKNPENIGTVNNCFNAVKLASGKYIKLISPGDELCTNILRGWIDYVECNKTVWSFGDAFFYNLDHGMNKRIISRLCNPQKIRCYKVNIEKQCRWNYLVFGDIVLGSTTICQRDIMLHYFSLISDKVRYAEDNIYRIMMFDDIVPCYYPKEVIFYEYGSGISTSQNKEWAARLHKDWIATDEIIYNGRQFNDFQKKVYKAYIINCNNARIKPFLVLFFKGKLSYFFKRHFFPRLSRL